MIDEIAARRQAEELLKCPSDHPEHPWTMESFAEGWLVRQGPLAGFRGQASYVIERETGRIMRFPSSVPPQRIREDYPNIFSRGTEEKLASPADEEGDRS